MKKMLAILLSAVMVLALLAGCGRRRLCAECGRVLL